MALRGDHSKEALSEKRLSTIGKTFALKTLPPPSPPRASEAIGVTGSAGLATSPHSAGSKPRPPDDQPEYLVPYINEFVRLVKTKILEDFDGSTLKELVGAIQFGAFQLSCMATYYKAKVGHYDRKI